MITLLIIIFIVSMLIIKKRETPEERRESDSKYLGDEFADKQYYRNLAKQQIKEEDKQESAEKPYNMFIPMRQGWTLPDRIKERTEKLQREAIEETKNKK
ncbi:hypothetical protein [Staphylococcus phage VB-SauS-SA2]|nr:hypothetical protein [Staphylococcus phage VB-SauS-SA2]